MWRPNELSLAPEDALVQKEPRQIAVAYDLGVWWYKHLEPIVAIVYVVRNAWEGIALTEYALIAMKKEQLREPLSFRPALRPNSNLEST